MAGQCRQKKGEQATQVERLFYQLVHIGGFRAA
jgi:hypothetical protein